MNMWDFGNENSVFRFGISPRFLHHFTKFQFPINPLYVFFQLVVSIFKIIQLWRFLNLPWNVPLFLHLLPRSPSFFFFSFLQIFTPLFWYLPFDPNIPLFFQFPPPLSYLIQSSFSSLFSFHLFFKSFSFFYFCISFLF